jgi:O-antigen/teichoic acid export membrane protein
MKLVELSNNLSKDLKKGLVHFKKQGTWVFFGRIYLMFNSFLMSIVLTKNLSLDGYGEYKYSISVFAIFALFSLPEASQIIVKYVPRGFDNALISLLKLRVNFSLIGSLFLCLVGVYFYFKSESFLFYFILAFFLPFYYGFNLFNPYLQAKENFRLLNILFVIRATCQLLAILIAFLFLDSFLYILAIYIISYSTCNFLFFLYVKKIYQLKNEIQNPKITKFFRKQVFLLSLVGILPIIQENIDKVLIAKYIDFNSLAVFSIGILIGKTVNGFFKPFISTFSAKLVSKTFNKRQYTFVFLGGTIFGVVLSLFIIPFLITTIYGNKYEGSILFSQIMICSLGIYFFHSLYYNQTMFNKKKTIKSIYVNNLCTPFLLLVILFIFLNMETSNVNRLILITLLYPIRLVISVLLIYLVNMYYISKKD